jgi:ATP-dependent Clp protease ATP-binding subunit ClpB
VLLDEIEKAHAEVFNVLLQLLDDGRLTDGQGRTVDFTNVVLIMTSNLAVDPSAFFRPEFLNRIDEIVHFRQLGPEDIERIVYIQLAHLRERLAARRLSLEVTDEAASLLAKKGYDPTYGARPLKRVIQKQIADPLALELLAGYYSEGDTVHVQVAGDDLVLK